jgi:hypothetical protein
MAPTLEILSGQPGYDMHWVEVGRFTPDDLTGLVARKARNLLETMPEDQVRLLSDKLGRAPTLEELQAAQRA